MFRPAYAEEEDREDDSREESLDGEYVWDEDEDSDGDRDEEDPDDADRDEEDPDDDDL